MQRLAVIALLLVVAFLPLGAASNDVAAAHAYFLEARELERKGDAIAALQLYKKAFTHDSRNRDLCFLYLGQLKGTGSIDSAYALASRCASLKGKASLAEYKLLGEVALRAEDESAALMFYREAYKLDEEDGDVLYLLAGLYEEAQDWEGYVEVVGALMPRLGYPAPLMERQLRAYSRLDRPNDALALLQDAWRATGRVAYGQSLAAYYDGRGMNLSLLEVARTLAATQPGPEHDWLLARAYAATDRTDSALGICERLLAAEKKTPAQRDSTGLGTDQSLRYFYTYLLFDRGRYAEAYASARIMVKARPEVASNYFLQGSAAVELRKSDARALLEKAVALAPFSPDYRARLAYADYVFNKPSKAVPSASARLTYPVTDSLKVEQALLLEGFAQGQLARMLDPREAWERPSVLSDTSAARRHRLQAVTRFEKVLTTDSFTPGQRAATFELATHLDKLGLRARSKDLLRKLVQQDTANPMALNYLGYMLVENLPIDSAEILESEGLLNRALALEPENGAYLDSKGWWFYRAGSLDSARVYLEKASQTISSDPAVRDHLKEVLQAQKRRAGP